MPDTDIAVMESKKIYAHEQWKQRTGAAIDYAQEAIKAAILINGGGAVAILALIGDLAKENNNLIRPRDLTVSLICFGAGVACAALSSACGYFAHNDYAKGFELLWLGQKKHATATPRDTEVVEGYGTTSVLFLSSHQY